jgi:hypothetical protein
MTDAELDELIRKTKDRINRERREESRALGEALRRLKAGENATNEGTNT